MRHLALQLLCMHQALMPMLHWHTWQLGAESRLEPLRQGLHTSLMRALRAGRKFPLEQASEAVLGLWGSLHISLRHALIPLEQANEAVLGLRGSLHTSLRHALCVQAGSSRWSRPMRPLRRPRSRGAPARASSSLRVECSETVSRCLSFSTKMCGLLLCQSAC